MTDTRSDTERATPMEFDQLKVHTYAIESHGQTALVMVDREHPALWCVDDAHLEFRPAKGLTIDQAVAAAHEANRRRARLVELEDERCLLIDTPLIEQPGYTDAGGD